MNNNPKSATTAGLLGIFLGAFGAHNWYLGEKKKGIIHVSLVGAGIVLLIVADAILPAMLSMRTALQIAGLLALINLVSGLLFSASSMWGFIEGIIILSQGDAGLARRGIPTAGAPMAQQPVAQQSWQSNASGYAAASEPQTFAGNSLSQEQNANGAGQTMNMAQPAVQMKPPKQPMDPAKKKKIIRGVVIGVVAVVVVTVAAVVISALLRVDYSEAYKVAKELKPEVTAVYQNTSCQRVIEYVDSTYTKPADYNEYADNCLSAGSEVAELTKKLGETAGVKRNSEIKAQFDKFSEGVEGTLPDKEELEKTLAIYKAWHEYEYLRNSTRTDSVESEVRSVAAPLISSGNDTLKTYGEGWLENALKMTQAYHTYNNLPYGDANKSTARTAYQNAQTDYKNWVAANKPDIKQLGGLNFDNNTKMYNEWTKLYKLISETYEENYNEGSGDCSEFLGEVYCD